MSNEERRLRAKLKVLGQHELPFKQVALDLLRLFDKEVNEFEDVDANYIEFLEGLEKNYKQELSQFTEGTQSKLF